MSTTLDTVPANSAASDAMASMRIRPWQLWFLGFFLTANLYLIPTMKLSPRFTDLLTGVLGIWLLVRLAREGLPRAPLLALMLLNFLPFIWFAVAFLTNDRQTLVLSGRWLAAIPWGMALTLLLQNQDNRRSFAWGMFWGLVVNILVLLVQAAGYDSSLHRLGFSTTDIHFSRFRKMVRLPGLHGGNSPSAAVASLIIPISLYLYLRYRTSLWVPLIGVLGLGIAMHLTSTRSPLLVGLLVLTAGIVLAKLPRRTLQLLIFVVLMITISLVTIGPPGGKVRWGDRVSAEENLGGRVLSGSRAMSLSLEHPFGMGVKDGRQALIEASAIPATHNAFLQASLFFGITTGLMLLVALVAMAWQTLRGLSFPYFLEGLLALHLLGLFFFEEHLNNPTFLILVNWLVATFATLTVTGSWVANRAPDDTHQP